MLGKGGWSYVVRYEARGRLIYFIVSLQNILNNENKIYITMRFLGWSETLETLAQPIKTAYLFEIYIAKKSSTDGGKTIGVKSTVTLFMES